MHACSAFTVHNTHGPDGDFWKSLDEVRLPVYGTYSEGFDYSGTPGQIATIVGGIDTVHNTFIHFSSWARAHSTFIVGFTG